MFQSGIVILIMTLTLFSCNRDHNPAGTGDDRPVEPVIETIDAAQAMDLIEANSENPDFIIIDIRTPGEYAGGHVENAINIDFYGADFRSEIDMLDRSKTYLIYCASGNRSGQALVMMENDDFLTVYNLGGGISTWRNAGYPVVKDL